MPITITTWNVQNLAPSSPVFADKIDFIVSILQALDSDGIALQEILDPTALNTLATRLGFQQVAAAPYFPPEPGGVPHARRSGGPAPADHPVPTPRRDRHQ